VDVIGGGGMTDGYVVTAAVKTALVARLQEIYGAYVWAFEGSSLDLGMLAKADQALIVVGEEGSKSKSTDGALENSTDNHRLQARQACYRAKYLHVLTLESFLLSILPALNSSIKLAATAHLLGSKLSMQRTK
jgi:hypothetical protein